MKLGGKDIMKKLKVPKNILLAYALSISALMIILGILFGVLLALAHNGFTLLDIYLNGLRWDQ